MNLPVNIKRVPIFGLGCVAGVAREFRVNCHYVRAYPKQVAAVLAVELCSLTLQQEDPVCRESDFVRTFWRRRGGSAGGRRGAGIEWSRNPGHAVRVLSGTSEHVMGWDISEKGFRIVLSREVPEVVHDHLASDVDAFLEKTKDCRDPISEAGCCIPAVRGCSKQRRRPSGWRKARWMHHGNACGGLAIFRRHPCFGVGRSDDEAAVRPLVRTVFWRPWVRGFVRNWFY